MNDVLEMNTKIYPDLLKYREFFKEGITIYFNELCEEEIIKDYISNEIKTSSRVKITSDVKHYKEMLKLIEVELNLRKGVEFKIVSQSILVNNILSVLLNIKQYN